jgi:Sortase domain
LRADQAGRHRKPGILRSTRRGLTARLGWAGLAVSGTAAAVLVAAPLAWTLRSDSPKTTLQVSATQAASVAGGRGERVGDQEAAPAKVAGPAASQVVSQRPRMIRLPSGTTVAVHKAATRPTGELMLPTNVNQAGWWDGGSRLGDPYGSLVIAAHVDSFTQGRGRFVELLSMHPGDRVNVWSANLRETFHVTSARLVPKPLLTPRSYAYSGHGPPRLVLITCGGPYDSVNGYHDNMVVVAAPLSGPRSLKHR